MSILVDDTYYFRTATDLFESLNISRGVTNQKAKELLERYNYTCVFTDNYIETDNTEFIQDFFYRQQNCAFYYVLDEQLFLQLKRACDFLGCGHSEEELIEAAKEKNISYNKVFLDNNDLSKKIKL